MLKLVRPSSPIAHAQVAFLLGLAALSGCSEDSKGGASPDGDAGSGGAAAAGGAAASGGRASGGAASGGAASGGRASGGAASGGAASGGAASGGAASGGAGGSATGGAAPDSGTPDSSTPADAGACTLTPGDAGASCNTVVNTGTNVTITATTGTVGVGTGGTVLNGTYFLSEVLAYPGSSLPDGVLIRQTIEICNGVAQLSENIQNSASSTHKSFTLAPVGTVPHLDMVCSTKSPDESLVYASYTATPTTLTLYHTGDAFQMTVTKQ